MLLKSDLIVIDETSLPPNITQNHPPITEQQRPTTSGSSMGYLPWCHRGKPCQVQQRKQQVQQQLEELASAMGLSLDGYNGPVGGRLCLKGCEFICILCIFLYINVLLYLYIYICIFLYIYIYSYIHIFIYIHIYTGVFKYFYILYIYIYLWLYILWPHTYV